MTTLHTDDRPGDDPDRRMEAFLAKHEAERLSEEDDEGMQFLVLEDDGVRDDRPIALWIHPGDACEHDHPEDEVRENAADFEHYMGEELLADDGYEQRLEPVLPPAQRQRPGQFQRPGKARLHRREVGRALGHAVGGDDDPLRHHPCALSRPRRHWRRNGATPSTARSPPM